MARAHLLSLALLALPLAAQALRLCGYGTSFSPTSAFGAEGCIDPASLNLTASPLFNITNASFIGCNVAYLPAEAAWLVPEGEDELHPEAYGFEVFRASDGVRLRAMPASAPYDMASLVFNPADGFAYAVGTVPPTAPDSTPYVIRINVKTGETSPVSSGLGPAGPYPASGIFSDVEPCSVVLSSSLGSGKGGWRGEGGAPCVNVCARHARYGGYITHHHTAAR